MAVGTGIFARDFGLGAVTVNSTGDITSAQDRGILVVSPGYGNIAITTNGGTVTGGPGYAGVEFIQGNNNTLQNYGTITSADGINGMAVKGAYGNEAVTNFGTIIGDVDLCSGLCIGINSLNNMAGGTFNAGPTVSLGAGAGNTLTNSGNFSPGGVGTIQTTALTGNLVQTGSGEFAVDLVGSNADRVDVSGSTELNGLVKPLFTLSGLGSFTQWTILTAGVPIVDNGIGVDAPPAVNFDLVFPTPGEMWLVLTGVNFVLEGLNRNETAIAENLNQVFETRNFPKLAPLIDALGALPSVGAIANALDQLSPEIYLDTEIATLFSGLAFTNSLMTCPVRDGAAAFIKEGQCVWARLSGRQFDQDQTFQTLGFDERSFEVAGGLQGALGEVWRIGFAGAYERSFLDTDETFATSDADRLNAGAVLKYNPGPLLLAAAVSGGWGWYDTERQINFPGFMALAQSDQDIGYVNGRFRAAYLFSNGGWYLKPLVDFDATHISLDGVKESGAGGVGLNVRGNDETVFSASPALELGAQFGGPSGTLVRPYIRGGATFFDDPDFVLLASFEGSPSGVGPFRIAANTDELVADLSAGVDVIGSEGASFRLYYDGRFGDTVEEHAGGIKATLPF